jgi:hypothetical protein
MESFGDILARGVLLPLRVYFQPRRVLAETAMSRNAAQPILIYLCSMLWIVVTIAVGMIIFGMPTPDRLTSLLTIPALFVLLGGALGFQSRVRNNETGKSFFNPVMATAFGLYLNMTFVVDMLMLEQISRRTGIDVAYVVDSPTLDYPTMFAMGAGLGLIFSAILGTRGRTGLLITYLMTGVMLAVMFTGPNPAVRAPNMAVFVTAGLLATHLPFQLIYLLIAGVSSLMLEIDPTASREMWLISPAHWCDLAYVPLPGLSNLLLGLHRQDAVDGMKAVHELRFHPFYSGIGERLAAQLGAPSL